MIAHRADSGVRRLTFREYARYVERFAGALHELGVGPGQVLAIQLPNWWQLSALMLAGARVGAVVAPIMPTLGPREMERTLVRLGASVCVTVERWAGAEQAGMLAKMASRLPMLKHRVVLGRSAPDSEVDFVEHFEKIPWERRHPLAVNQSNEDPDRGAVVLFTSGISGEPKGVLHSFNTLYAGAMPVVEEEAIASCDRVFTSPPLQHVFGMLYGIVVPLLAGACAVISDDWQPDDVPRMLAESEVTVFAGVPSLLGEMVAATERSPVRPPAAAGVHRRYHGARSAGLRGPAAVGCATAHALGDDGGHRAHLDAR